MNLDIFPVPPPCAGWQIFSSYILVAASAHSVNLYIHQTKFFFFEERLPLFLYYLGFIEMMTNDVNQLCTITFATVLCTWDKTTMYSMIDHQSYPWNIRSYADASDFYTHSVICPSMIDLQHKSIQRLVYAESTICLNHFPGKLLAGGSHWKFAFLRWW